VPNYDLGLLITLDIGLTLIGILVAVIGLGMMTRHFTPATRDITTIQRDVAFMIRRQYKEAMPKLFAIISSRDIKARR
jgi:hypothetical protein